MGIAMFCRRRYLAAVAVLLATALSGGARGADPDRVALIEYPVYDAVLRPSLVGQTGILAIIDVTEPRPLYGSSDPERVKRITRDLDLTKDCPVAFRQQNRRSVEIENGFRLPTDHFLMAESVFDRYFAGERPEFGWKRFFDRYPDTLGVVWLSRVALCDDRERALVYVQYGCGPECGSGRFVSLARRDGDWEVQGVYREWFVTDADWTRSDSN